MRQCWNWEPAQRPSFLDIHYAMENMFQESSITEEVRRQLSRGTPTPQLPHKKPRNGSLSSLGSSQRHKDKEMASPSQLASLAPPDNDPAGTTPILSTFGGAKKDQHQQQQQPQQLLQQSGSDSFAQGIVSTKSTVVQLRRNTNKKGRQAPTPPKRTRSIDLIKWLFSFLSAIPCSHLKPAKTCLFLCCKVIQNKF